MTWEEECNQKVDVTQSIIFYVYFSCKLFFVFLVFNKVLIIS